MNPEETDFPTFGLARSPDPALGASQILGCTIDERFTLEALIGQGGFGWVFRARQKTPDRAVAVKVSKRLATAAGRMVREANLLGNLDDARVARVHDAGVWQSPTGPRMFVAMELVQGGMRIDEYCQSKALPPVGRIELFREVCRAVQVAHSRDIVHRDLKPGNVLIDADGRPRIIDFGIAKALGNTLDPPAEAAGDTDRFGSGETTATGGFLGTHSYAAPEQLSGAEHVTKRTDVYALGRILQDLFPSDSMLLPRGLDQIVQRSLANNQLIRFADARALEQAIADWTRKSRRRRIARSVSVPAGLLIVLFSIAWWASGRNPLPPRPPLPSPSSLAELATWSGVTAVAPKPNATEIAFVDANEPIALAPAGRQPRPTIRLSASSLEGEVTGLCFDQAGRHLAAATARSAVIWDTQRLERDMTPRSMPVPENVPLTPGSGGMAFAHDASRLFLRAGEHAVMAFDARSSQMIADADFGPAGVVTAVCQGTDPETAFIGLNDGSLHRWHPPAAPLLVAPPMTGIALHCLAAMGTSGPIVSCGSDRIVRLRDGRTGAVLHESGPVVGKPQALACVKDSVYVACVAQAAGGCIIVGLTVSPKRTLEPASETPVRCDVSRLACSETCLYGSSTSAAGRGTTTLWQLSPVTRREAMLPSSRSSANAVSEPWRDSRIRVPAVPRLSSSTISSWAIPPSLR